MLVARKNDTALGTFSRYPLQGLIDPLASLTADPLLDLGPEWTVTGYRTLAKEERYLGNGVREWSLSKRTRHELY